MKPPLSIADRLCLMFDQALRTLSHQSAAKRPYPAKNVPESTFTPREKRHIASLMRINHVGEVCAQALYQGQALTARDTHVQEHMKTAAEEEKDHLSWCEQRLKELNDRPSYLNPLWYAASLSVGALAGACGDRVSLSFLAATEEQVTQHLRDHLKKLPHDDQKTALVLAQMQTDEAAHAQHARDAGGETLPLWIQQFMRAASGVMTRISYWI